MGNCVGLFGTCGRSEWRKIFMEKYQKEAIEFFNPQVENWSEELAVVEAEHLAEDKIVLFPITNEEYSLGSLSEVGFSVLNAIKLDNRRDFIIMIEQNLLLDLNDEKLRKESLRARALVKQHLLKMQLDNLYVVDNFDDMLDASILLYQTNELREGLSKFNPHKK